MVRNEEALCVTDNIKNLNSNYIVHLCSLSWGNSIYVMEKNGNAYVHLYIYNDDYTTVYLEGLHVSSEFRMKGMGKELIQLCEDITKKLGAMFSCLFVKRNNWMYEWYRRRGYKDLKEHEEKDLIWMIKNLL